MSTPSINSSKSPPPQWLSNDAKPSAARQGSEYGVASEQKDATTSDKAVTSTSHGGDIEKPSTLPMSYPIDENLFYSAPSQQLTEDNAADIADANDSTYKERTTVDLLPPPDFKALFTLIEDSETDDHYHPTVHYIFSDDDPEILTSAALAALDSNQDASRADDIEERHVIIDMAADGKSVTSASSMSPDWQALKTTIRRAPSWGEDSKSADIGLMLKISGQESKLAGASKEKKKPQQQLGNLDYWVETFAQRLEAVDEVLGTAQNATIEADTTE